MAVGDAQAGLGVDLVVDREARAKSIASLTFSQGALTGMQATSTSTSGRVSASPGW